MFYTQRNVWLVLTSSCLIVHSSFTVNYTVDKLKNKSYYQNPYKKTDNCELKVFIYYFGVIFFMSRRHFKFCHKSYIKNTIKCCHFKSVNYFSASQIINYFK